MNPRDHNAARFAPSVHPAGLAYWATLKCANTSLHRWLPHCGFEINYTGDLDVSGYAHFGVVRDPAERYVASISTLVEIANRGKHHL